MMIKKLIYAVIGIATALTAHGTNEISGTWSGNLSVQGHTLRLVFHIGETKNGANLPVITMDSPDQGATNIPVQTDFCNTDSIAISAPAMRLTYTGSRTGDTITGTFSQMGMKIPLILQRGENKRNRPQTPQPPFPYNTKDVKFNSIADSITLGGTLVLPENANPDTPVIVMVSGSGQQNRDEELFDHKPFAVIADRLARAGIGSLRYDDRGVGESGGNPLYAVTADFALDAEGAIRMLRNAGYKNIGLIGHSEGGSIAFIAANSKNAPDFIVTLGAPAAIGKDILLEQICGKISDSGLNETDVKSIREVLSGVFGTITDNPDATAKELKSLIRENMDENIPRYTASSGMAAFVLESMKNDLSTFESPWMRAFLAYDPANDIKNTNVPALALYGSKDTQVMPSINVPLMQKYNDKVKIRVYENLNHLMQPCLTGKSTEYPEIETTFDEAVITDIIDFIKSL